MDKLEKNIHRSHGATVQYIAYTIPSFKSSPNSSNVHFHPFHMPLPATTSCSNRGNPPQNILVQLLFLSDHETEYSQRYLKDINGCKIVQQHPPFLLSWHKTQYFWKDPPIFNMLLNCLLN